MIGSAKKFLAAELVFTHMALSLPDALRVHATLQQLLPRVADERIYFRKPAAADKRFQRPGDLFTTVVDRDRAISGLTNKAGRTHAAIRLLVDAGLIVDALALCRVMMENVFVLSWILQDSALRLDIYVLADELFRRHLAEVTVEHYGHNPQMCADANQRLADKRSEKLATVLEGSWSGWARREENGKLIAIGAKAMFHDLGVVGPDGQKNSFIYDVPYFMQSHYVHSTIFSQRAFDLGASRSFRLDLLPSNSKANEVMNAANLFMIQGLADFASYTGAECFQPELDQVWREMKGEVAEVETSGIRDQN